MWEKIFAKDVTDKGLVSKIYKQLMCLNIKKKKKTTQSKDEQKIYIEISPKKTFRCSRGILKDAQHH